MDAKTIQRARRNDRAAQAALLRAFQDVWFRICRTMLDSDDLASDATQETAARFLRDLAHFKGKSSISTWSIGIAINVAREIRRSARPVNPNVRRAQLTAMQRIAPAADEIASGVEETQNVRAMLLDLPERQRKAIMLRFFENMSVEETAVVMGCATGTVKATVHQALRTLRRRLRQTT